MSTVMNDSFKSTTRNIRRIEAPRPLRKANSDTKSNSNPLPRIPSIYNVESVDKLVILMDMVVEEISQNEDSPDNTSGDTATVLTDNIVYLCKQMKIFGSQLEKSFQDQLDRACTVFRNAIIRGSLEYPALKCILDVLESRKCLWNTQEPTENFPSSLNNTPENDLSELKNYVKTHSVDNNSAEILRRSSRNTSKALNKNYVKDEVVIRNSDSGKVMGIKGRRVHMIEQLSDTVISFQRVAPSAKERLVQITGANKGNVESATRLIRETIRNNASPIRELLPGSNSSFSSEESFLEQLSCDESRNCETKDEEKFGSLTNNESYLYKHKVLLSNCELTITGDDYTYVTVAKAVLDDYFSNLHQSAEVEKEDSNRVAPDYHTGTRKDVPNSTFKASFATPPEPSLSATPLPDEFLAENVPIEREEMNASNCAVKSWLNTDSSIEYPGVTGTLISDETSLDDIVVDNALSVAESLEKSTPAASTELTAITYTKEFILECRSFDLSQKKPKDWDHISSNFPAIVKTSDDPIDVEEHICEDFNE